MKSNSQAQSKIYWVYLIGFFIILALPLLNLPLWFSPPDWGKTIVFRIILSILIFFFIWQLLFRKGSDKISTTVEILSDRRNRAFWPFWLLIALLGVFFLATVFSLNPYFSFWGSPHRSGGFLNFAFYVIFAILAFFTLRKKDWKKIWFIAIGVGILVSFIAILQQFQLFSEYLVPYATRPLSTVGGSIFLAIYLLLLSFPALSFAIKEKNVLKKIFYLFSLFLFIFVAIFLTQARAVFLGLSIGFLYFLIFYPTKKKWVSVGIKIVASIILLLAIYGVYYINTQPNLPNFVKENEILKDATNRLLIKGALDDTRFIVWGFSWNAVKERPILGYGPENFSIAFDKYYDPSLSGIDKPPGDVAYSWWNRAHNFIFDISVTAGIPALIIYLSLFGVLFWQLQKLKSNLHKSAEISINQRVIYHGIQTTFLAYLVANFFSFDTFSLYLISFLLIGYSLHLISSDTAENTPNNTLKESILKKICTSAIKWRKLILVSLLIILIWFVWVYNLKPLQINKEINWAVYYSKEGNYQKAFQKMEKVLSSHSIIDNYLRLQYIEIINEYIEKDHEKTLELTKKGIQILKEAVELRPYYTRSWWALGAYTNFLIGNAPGFKIEVTENLKKEAITYCEKAHQLNPNRWEILKDCVEAYSLNSDYEKAKEKAQKCIDVNPNLSDCYWLMGLTQGYLENFEEFNSFIALAQEKGYNINSKESLSQLINVYIKTENYQGLAETFQKLILIEPKNAQLHASLAVAYKELGEIEKAKEEALKVLELQPEAKAGIEEFLRSLEQ